MIPMSDIQRELIDSVAGILAVALKRNGPGTIEHPGWSRPRRLEGTGMIAMGGSRERYTGDHTPAVVDALRREFRHDRAQRAAE